MQITQKTYLSKTSKIATLFVFALMIGVAIFTYLTVKSVYPAIFILVILVAICVVAMFFMPTSVRLDEKTLTVIFPCRTKTFPFDQIEKAAPFDPTNRMWRVCGSGAFFGWWGWFAVKGEGKFMVYASNLDHLLFIRLKDGKKYVISCADPEAITKQISK